MTIEIIQQVTSKLPVDFTGVVPDRPDVQTVSDIECWKIRCGNSTVQLGELFDVSVNDDKQSDLKITGDLSNVSNIGRGLVSGRIILNGDCGSNLGLQMRGGTILCNGNAGDYAGAEMGGGTIRITGNVGDYCGANLSGSKIGMNRGQILITGDAGNYLGRRMRRGLIFVAGMTADYLGWNMRAGTIITNGCSGVHVGNNMIRGTIVINSDFQPGPTFKLGGINHPGIMTMLMNFVKSKTGGLDSSFLNQKFKMFHGDRLMGGRGEIFVPAA